MKAKITPILLVLLASIAAAAAQTTGGSPGGSTSTPGATAPAAPNAGTRGLSPNAPIPGVTDPRTGTPQPPNTGPRIPDASTYTNHPGTMPQPSPNQQGGVVTDPERAQPGQASSQRPGVAQSANSDGYAECMSLWNPATNRASRQDWSKTCERTRLPQR
jgi:hypothetical protein